MQLMKPGWREETTDTADGLIERSSFDAAGVLRLRGLHRGPRQTLVNGKAYFGKPTGQWVFFDEHGKQVAQKDLTLHSLDLSDDELLEFARTDYEVGPDAVYVGNSVRFGRAYKNHWRVTGHDGLHRVLTFDDGPLKATATVESWADDALPAGPWNFFAHGGELIASIEFTDSEATWSVFNDFSAVCDTRTLPLFIDFEGFTQRTLLRPGELHALHLISRCVQLPKTDLFARASAIDWRTMSDDDELRWYAFREIDHHVPELVNALVCGDLELATGALHRLATDTWHQGTVYEASSKLTPLLLQAAQHQGAPRDGLLELLGRYAKALETIDETVPWLEAMRAALRDSGLSFGG